MGSVVVEHGLSCSEALWHAPRDLPGPGIEPVSPVVAGGFPSTVPPEKSPQIIYIYVCVRIYIYKITFGWHH